MNLPTEPGILIEDIFPASDRISMISGDGDLRVFPAFDFWDQYCKTIFAIIELR